MIRKTKLFCEPLEQRTLFATISFAPHVDFVAGTAPVALAAADFDVDGNQDLAVADSSTDKVDIFLGNGGGSFSAGATLSLSGIPSSIVVGDFNGDKRPDIAVACSPAIGQTTSTVTVFLNTGSGTFGLGQITSVETGAVSGEPVELAAGDFNNDGNLDLAVTDFTTQSISILLGNHTGTFAPPDNYVANSNPTAITAADFNNDGFIDLAVANTSTDSSGAVTNGVGLLMGSSTGSFTAGANLAISTTGVPVGIATADLTTATQPGLIVVNTDGTAAVLTNTTGTFSSPTLVNAGPEASGLAVGDFDLDGNADFVATNGGATASTSNNSVTVLPGEGAATVGTAIQFSSGAQPSAVVVADFNNDGKPDIATANAAAGTVSVLINNTVVALVPTTTMLTSASSSSPADSNLTLTATITGTTTSPLPNAAYPTGTVNFYDGAALLGTSTVTANSNQATLVTSSLTVGTHVLRAVYVGDTAFATSASARISQLITPTASDTADLIGTFVSTSFGNQIAPGETGTVSIQVTNQGSIAASGTVTNEVFLSQDTALDSGDTELAVRGVLEHTNVHLKSGQSITLKGTVTVPLTTPLASYSILTLLNSTGSLAEFTTSNNLVVSPTTYAVADVFGTLGTNRNVSLQAADLARTLGTFKLSGPGMGTVTVGDSGVDLLLAGTAAASTLTITSKGAAFQINNLSAAATIRSVVAADVAVNQSIALPGGVTAITLASFGTTAASAITLGGTTQATLSLGSVAGATLTAASGIKSLSISSWGAGSITAPSIGMLRSSGSFSPQISLSSSGVALKSASIGGSLSGDWNVSGSIGAIAVTGSIANAEIMADSNIASVTVSGSVGDSQILAGLTGPSLLGSLRVKGTFSNSLIGAGATPSSGNTSGLPSTALRSDGTIRSISISGSVDANSEFLAAIEPKRAIFGGVAVVPATDPRFKLLVAD